MAKELLLHPLRVKLLHTATAVQDRMFRSVQTLKILHSVRRLGYRKMTYINKSPTYHPSGSIGKQLNQPPPEQGVRGLGDLIEKVTVNTGIKRIVDKIAKATGKDCGCNKRKDTLNRLVPFKKEDGNG